MKRISLPLIAMSLSSTFTVLTIASLSEARTLSQDGTREVSRQVSRDLPPKRSLTRESLDSFASRSRADLDRAVSDRAKLATNDLRTQTTPTETSVVTGRIIVPAPEGDAAEPLGADSAAVETLNASATTNASVPSAKLKQELKKSSPSPAPARALAPTAKVSVKVPTKVPEKVPTKVKEKAEDATEQSSTSIVVLPIPTPRPTTFTASPPPAAAPPQTYQVDSDTSLQTISVPPKPAMENRTFVMVRGSYMSSKVSRFDSRMKDGVTALGLGVARKFNLDFGAIEGRAIVDVYHGIDQSVAVDTIRMISSRAEAAYWFSHGRVQTGVSLGFGMADYSVRSYHVDAAIPDGATPAEVKVRNHASSKAFLFVPGTELRVGLVDDVSIDAQTEYIAVLGGTESDSVSGLGFTLSLGWVF